MKEVFWGGRERKGSWGQEGSEQSRWQSRQSPSRGSSILKGQGSSDVNHTQSCPSGGGKRVGLSPHPWAFDPGFHSQIQGWNWHFSSSVWVKRSWQFESSRPESVTGADGSKPTQTEVGRGTPRNSKRDPRGTGQIQWPTVVISRRKMCRGLGLSTNRSKLEAFSPQNAVHAVFQLPYLLLPGVPSALAALWWEVHSCFGSPPGLLSDGFQMLRFIYGLLGSDRSNPVWAWVPIAVVGNVCVSGWSSLQLWSEGVQIMPPKRAALGHWLVWTEGTWERADAGRGPLSGRNRAGSTGRGGREACYFHSLAKMSL